MTVIIPFDPLTVGRPSPHPGLWRHNTYLEQVVVDAVRRGADRSGVLDVAANLIEHCRDRYGFTVMRSGLPTAPCDVAAALIALARGLALVKPDMGGRPLWAFSVYFGHDALDWFEDGYSGCTGLAVPDHHEPSDLAAFVRPRLRALSDRSRAAALV